MPKSYTDGAGNQTVIEATIGAYAKEAYTDAKRLSNTGLVTGNDTIDPNGETFVGQMRWKQPLNPVINIASLVDPTDGVPSNAASDFLRYIKTIRTFGRYKVNLAEVVTKEDALRDMGDDFANARAKDEHNAVLSILKAVAISEVLRGAGTSEAGVGLGGQTFDNDPANRRYGMYVDMGNNPFVSATGTGAARVQAFIEAIGMAWKDYEPDYAYLVADPMMVAGLRSANLIDTDRVTDGSIDFETILSGKLRLVKSRANASFSGAELAKLNTGAGIDLVGTKTSFVVLPGAIALEELNIPKPVGIDNDEAAYHGGGTTDIWHRWGYVAHPVGYNWNGPDTKFPSDADYQSVMMAPDTPIALTDAGVTDADLATPMFTRKSNSALSMGILPVFHG